jgi:hypothetical protein
MWNQNQYLKYCHVFGVCMTNNNGFWIRWLDLLALLYNYNQLWQLTINDSLRLAPFLTGLRMSSLPLGRMPNEESLLTYWTLFCHSQSHIATDGQSVCPSWRRAPAGAHDQIFLLVWKLLSCPCGAPSLTRGRVCRLSVMVGSISSLSFVQLFTILLLKHNRMYNIYKASVSPVSVQQTMHYF